MTSTTLYSMKSLEMIIIYMISELLYYKCKINIAIIQVICSNYYNKELLYSSCHIQRHQSRNSLAIGQVIQLAWNQLI
jgi:hypothetical protein